jgi:hypothetical protein
MGRGVSGRFWARTAVAAALVVVLGSLAAPTVAGAAQSGRGAPTTPTSSAPSVAAVFAASATWDGTPVSSAGSPGSAFALSKGQTALVDFTYTEGLGGALSNATLSLTYLGVVLTTSSSATHIVGGPPITGAAQINWSFGPLYDALEGVFQLTASLLYPNGSTAWSESFYVFAKAPYLLESGAVVVLLILTIAELYWGLAAIRDARRGRKPSAPASPPGGTPSTPPTPGTPPPAAGAGSTPPAEGGSSVPPPASPPGGGGGTP